MQDLVLKDITFTYILKLYKNKYLIRKLFAFFSLIHNKNLLKYLNRPCHMPTIYVDKKNTVAFLDLLFSLGVSRKLSLSNCGSLISQNLCNTFNI